MMALFRQFQIIPGLFFNPEDLELKMQPGSRDRGISVPIFVVVICVGCILLLLWRAVGRTEPNLNDLGLAFDELHISLSELRDYVENVDSKAFPYDVVEFPATKSSCLFPVEQDSTAETKDGLGASASQTELEGMLNIINIWVLYCSKCSDS